MPKCIVNGCTNDAKNNIGVRLRKPDTSAIWAPNADAFICDAHAQKGFDIFVDLQTRDDDNIETSVSANGSFAVKRTTIIRDKNKP